MVIDDDPDFIAAMRMVLESGGYIMKEAKSAEEGLKTYKSINPDIILVDLMMEEIDSGTNFVKELKLMGNKAPVFLLSAAGDEMTDVVDYAQLGFAGVFQKPIDNKRLLNVIKAKLK
jgi:two-component system alkaline phosphatase synthesis response regulator PhoP